MDNVEIVAEIGCNHNGNIDIAKKLLNEAKKAGADYAKFQLFKTELLVSPSADLAEYQKKNTHEESQFDMLKKLELSQNEYIDILDYAKEIGIEIFATPFDIDSVDFLAKLNQKLWKIPSGEITNLPLLEKIVEINCTDKTIVLSTGMCTLDEIDDAVRILEKSVKTKFIILQCNTQYPTEDADMNLLVMNSLKKRYPKWEVGLSDHSDGIIASITAVGLGAVFVEKHFTLDREMEGPDHKASITPLELKELCEGIRRAEKMLGSASKTITESEVGNREIARKSIVAANNIRKNDVFTEQNLTCKRPGTGMSPMLWHKLIGRRATKDYLVNELIKEELANE